MAWIEVLQSTDRSKLKSLFPNGRSGAFSFDEAKRFAQTLFELRDELGGSAHGMDFARIATLPDHSEHERWADLASLESAYREVLSRRGLRDHNDLRASLALGHDKPEGVTHIWLAGLTDPQPLFITALERMKDHFHIQAIVGADPSEAENFDEWGRPRPEAWADRRSDWKDFKRCVHVVGDAQESFRQLRSLLANTKPTDGVHAVCACDREVDAPKITALIHSMGGEAVNPLGTAHGSHGLHHALRAWGRCLTDHEPDFLTIRQALRIPGLLKITTGGGTPEAFTEINEQLDVADRSMLRGPASRVIAQISELVRPEGNYHRLKDYESLQKLPARIESLLKLRESHLSIPWDQALKATLTLLTADQKLREDDPDGAFAIEVAETVLEYATEIGRAHAGGGSRLSHEQLFGLTLDAASTERHRRSDAQEAVNLPGWVEAPWDPVPHMIVFGLNDHLLPRTVHAHPYLPATLRKAVGLPSNEAVFASAAFTLEQLWRRREGKGRLDIVVPQQDAEGNPLRPSRLLFQAPDESLTQRVAQLFSDAPNTEAQPYWQIPEAYKFVPLADSKDAARVIKSVSPTAIRSYLADPAEFWLNRALGLDETTHEALELDNAGFGQLIHGALQLFGQDNIDKLETRIDEIRRQFDRCLEKHVADTFGRRPQTALRLQIEAAKGRLNAFAAIQAKMASEGWTIKQVEGALPKFAVDKVDIRGAFDRLDQNSRTGEWRVYDYKTFTNRKNPVSTHTTKGVSGAPFTSNIIKRTKGEPNGETKPLRWTDLQLPIYHLALRKGEQGLGEEAKVHVGYLCLPAQASDAAEEIWANYQEDFAAAAEQQIEAVIAEIKRGGAEAFKPSEEGSDYPLLKALKSRRMKDYLRVELLGGTKP